MWMMVSSDSLSILDSGVDVIVVKKKRKSGE